MSTQPLSVNMPLDVIYLYGTVNGVEASFSLTEAGVWRAVVPKAVDHKYTIVITAYNSLGTPTEYNIVLFYLDAMLTPKTDWTDQDYYNFNELDRVEANTQYIAQLMKTVGYTPPDIVTNASRGMGSFEKNQSMNRIENNMELLASSFYTPDGWIAPKTNWARKKGFSYVDANRLEINLSLFYDMLISTIQKIKYCGEFSCGEDVL